MSESKSTPYTCECGGPIVAVIDYGNLSPGTGKPALTGYVPTEWSSRLAQTLQLPILANCADCGARHHIRQQVRS